MTSLPVLTIDDIAALLGVKSRTVTQWMVRSLQTPDAKGQRRLYADDPFPAPVRYAGKSPLWNRDQEEQIKSWNARRPGRGAGGGPKPRTPRPAS